MPLPSPPDAVILLAHGARDARWLEPFFRMRADLRTTLGPTPVALAFMELSEPSFANATAEVVLGGALRVLVVPVFLSGGGHVSKDVPVLVGQERERHPQVTFSVSGALGEEPELEQAMRSAVVRLMRGPGTMPR